jgi:hypothetical protein
MKAAIDMRIIASTARKWLAQSFDHQIDQDQSSDRHPLYRLV